MNRATRGLILSLLLFSCATTGPKTVPTYDWSSGGAVAVWDIEDHSPMRTAQPDLSEFITARVLETLKTQGANVVERQKLHMILRELALGASELADPKTLRHIGHLVGANRMIFGDYKVIGNNMRIDLRLDDVETGLTLTAAGKTVEGSNLDEWLAAAEEITRKLSPR